MKGSTIGLGSALAAALVMMPMMAQAEPLGEEALSCVIDGAPSDARAGMAQMVASGGDDTSAADSAMPGVFEVASRCMREFDIPAEMAESYIGWSLASMLHDISIGVLAERGVPHAAVDAAMLSARDMAPSSTRGTLDDDYVEAIVDHLVAEGPGASVITAPGVSEIIGVYIAARRFRELEYAALTQ